jgi:hypothetical protein
VDFIGRQRQKHSLCATAAAATPEINQMINPTLRDFPRLSAAADELW